MTEPKESNRARVRRLLLVPLGFRSPKGTSPEAERILLDGVADDLAYLTDEDLAVLAQMLAVHGDGAAKCFWPARATFNSFAHIVRGRPLVEQPSLLRWWASEQGQRMVQEGTLVETYQYFERHKMPPVKPGAREKVLASAQQNARDLTVMAEKERVGIALSAEALAWRRWYLERQAYLTALVDQARAARAQAASQGDAA